MIQSMVGCGGMGEVYPALDTQRAHTNWINSSLPVAQRAAHRSADGGQASRF